jgi:hypothetical protein
VKPTPVHQVNFANTVIRFVRDNTAMFGALQRSRYHMSFQSLPISDVTMITSDDFEPLRESWDEKMSKYERYRVTSKLRSYLEENCSPFLRAPLEEFLISIIPNFKEEKKSRSPKLDAQLAKLGSPNLSSDEDRMTGEEEPEEIFQPRSDSDWLKLLEE